MLKALLLAGFTLACTSFALAQNSQTNYQLLINGKVADIDLDKPLTFKTAKGEELQIELKQNDVLFYQDNMVSLSYPKEFSISKSVLDANIEQLAIITANGSGVMIQKYSSMNPSILVDMMLQEVTKESISYGYTNKEQKFENKLVSGQLLKGKTCRLNYKDDEQTYTVAALGGKDEGIIVMTMLNTSYKKQDQHLLDMVISTLSYTNQ
jgi:hypothetical protein